MDIKEKDPKVTARQGAETQEEKLELKEAGARDAQAADTTPEAEEPQERQEEDIKPEDEIEKLRQQVGEANDKYVRLMAEFDNYRRRSARERLELIETASKEVLEGFLPVVDDCERALDALRKVEGEGASAAIEGTELIYNKLTAYLKSRGLTRIECNGEEFNTDFHEAVAQFPALSPDMKNKIIDVVQQGYMLGGKVVRFAKVVVGI